MQLQTSSLQRFYQSLALVVALVASVLVVDHVEAISASPSPTVSPSIASGLEISPATVDLSGAKGKTYTIRLKMHNITRNTLSYTTSVNDFAAKDETGTPKLLTLGELPATASITSWVHPPASLTLAGGEIRTISIPVTIPNNAEAGGHYGVVNFTSADPNAESNTVGVRASTGLLVLAKVAGEINEDLSVASLTVEKDHAQGSVFDSTPISFVSRLKDQGNVHLKPSGTITVSDMFGKTVGTVDVNSAKGNVLPGSIRRFESAFDRDWLFGRYTAELTVGYGTKGQVAQAEVIFWIIPWKIVGTVLAVLVTLIFIASRLLKVYNRYVINKYKQTTDDKQSKKPKKRKG